MSSRRFSLFFSLLLAALAGAGWDSLGTGQGRLQACFRYLDDTDALEEIQPFIPWQAIAKLQPTQDEQVFSGQLSKPVWIQFIYLGTELDEGFLRALSLARQFSNLGVGPRIVGTTFDPDFQSQGAWGLIAQSPPGANVLLRYSDTQTSWKLPANITVSKRTLTDIERAFKAINDENIKVANPGFLLTANSRASLIQFSPFVRGRAPSQSRIYNDLRRQRLVEFLKQRMR